MHAVYATALNVTTGVVLIAGAIAVTRRIIAITVPGLTVVVSPHKTFRRRFNDPKWAAVYKAAQSNDTDDAVKEEK